MKSEASKYPLSIITINLNNRDGLKKTIESVVNQTYQNFEYIVIDGASADGSVEVIQDYTDKINYWVSEPDSGIYNAMNKGIRVAQGEYLLFLNSGDWLYDDDTLNQAIPFLNESISIYTGDIIFKSNIGEQYIQHPEKLSFTYLMGRGLAHQSSFISKELFNKYGFYDESLTIVADWAFFFVQLGIHNESYRRIPVIISVFDLFGISANEIFFNSALKDKVNIVNKYLPPLLVKELFEIKRLNNRIGVLGIQKILAVTSGTKSKQLFNRLVIVMNKLIIIKNKIRTLFWNLK